MDAKELLVKYKSGNCTAAEKAIVETWYLQFEEQAPQVLSDTELQDATDRIWDRLPIHEENLVRRKLWPRIGIAAAILLMISSGIYFFNDFGFNHPDLLVHTDKTQQILPGGNKATLTLADGRKITLDGAVNGELAEQSGIIITKTKDGQLVYTVSDKGSSLNNGKATMNVVSTPKGGQYQVNLPDGTKVWLNAASSLSYPAVFTGAERKVSLTGEAYFEVAKVHPAKTFKVSAAKQTVEVLGTHFNINSYSDEPAVKTTLLEGSVKVSAIASGDIFLKPGQQAVLLENQLNVNLANTEDAVAWKNGMFRFKDADLQTVMRSVARWYDVEVSYEGNLPGRQFSGEIHRDINLSEVLDILSFFKVHFKIEGKKIIVTK